MTGIRQALYILVSTPLLHGTALTALVAYIWFGQFSMEDRYYHTANSLES